MLGYEAMELQHHLPHSDQVQTGHESIFQHSHPPFFGLTLCLSFTTWAAQAAHIVLLLRPYTFFTTFQDALHVERSSYNVGAGNGDTSSHSKATPAQP
jgi:hypothetical protein